MRRRGRKPGPGANRIPPLPGAMAAGVRAHGAPPGTRSAGVALVFAFPTHLRRKLRTTNPIERCFVEVHDEPGPWSASST
jgi:hypothetical protein